MQSGPFYNSVHCDGDTISNLFLTYLPSYISECIFCVAPRDGDATGIWLSTHHKVSAVRLNESTVVVVGGPVVGPWAAV